jgi:hypothetical protein
MHQLARTARSDSWGNAESPNNPPSARRRPFGRELRKTSYRESRFSGLGKRIAIGGADVESSVFLAISYCGLPFFPGDFLPLFNASFGCCEAARLSLAS